MNRPEREIPLTLLIWPHPGEQPDPAWAERPPGPAQGVAQVLWWAPEEALGGAGPEDLVSRSPGEVVVFCAAARRPSDPFFRQVAQVFEDPRVAAAGGPSPDPLAAEAGGALLGAEASFAFPPAGEPAPAALARYAYAFRIRDLRGLAWPRPGVAGRDGITQHLGLCLAARGGLVVSRPELARPVAYPPGLWGYALEQFRRGWLRFSERRLSGRLPFPPGQAFRREDGDPVVALTTLALAAEATAWDPARALTLAAAAALLAYPLHRPYLKWLSRHEPRLVGLAAGGCLLRPLARTLGMLAAAVTGLDQGGE
ncbi:MAG: hypothetical protein KQJ78_01830 [Deltaproteobacteria bacterium]|nr:hypothetical protein [Deltaproteobacteria bacterium]